MNRFRSLLHGVAFALAFAGAAFAGNTVFFTGLGDLTFPFSPPTSGGTVPGLIDNMTLGATTPRPATFTTVRTTTNANLGNQGAPAAKTVSATLTAAEVATGIITVNQGAGAASALTLPLATAMDTQFPTSVAGDSFDFSVINISTVAAEDATVVTNTGWTLVGNIDIASNAAATDKSAGRFRARKTGTGAWVLYRLS